MIELLHARGQRTYHADWVRRSRERSRERRAGQHCSEAGNALDGRTSKGSPTHTKHPEGGTAERERSTAPELH